MEKLLFRFRAKKVVGIEKKLDPPLKKKKKKNPVFEREKKQRQSLRRTY